MKLYRTLILVLASSLLMAGCAHKDNRPASNINGFAPSAEDTKINAIRMAILKDTATSVAAQSGLAWASQHINTMLTDNERSLDQAFNFNALMLKHNVVPPVLTEGRNALVLDSPESLRLADKIYKIESPPRFATTPPTWREYLWMEYQPPDRPNNSLLPRNDEERAIWNQAVTEGWQDGISQANQIFSANMGRLKRDYNGMITYRVLLMQNMVTPPYVAQTELGVTGDANQLRINDQVLRITATSKLVPNSKAWNPIVVPGTPGAIRKQGIQGTETLE